MKILLLDTSQNNIQGQVFDKSKVIKECTLQDNKNTLDVLDVLMDNLLKDLSLDNIDYFAVGIGPGLHTGLKMGIAYLEAVAQMKGKNIIPIESGDMYEMRRKIIEKIEKKHLSEKILPIYTNEGL